MNDPAAPVHRSAWWQWLLPAALLRADLQVLLVSRLLSELGMATLTYGAMVHLARQGADQLEVTLLTTAGATAALAFGLQGGLIADSSSKRVALALAYLLQAALCVLVPMLLGTAFLPLLLLVFAVRLLTQVVSPAVKSAVVLVSSTAEIGIAVTLLTMAGGIGSGVGTAVLAPVLIKAFDLTVMLYVVAGLLAAAAVRTLRLRRDDRFDRDAGGSDPEGGAAGPGPRTLRATIPWLLANPVLASIVASGATVAVLNDVFESLQPVFVRDDLLTDPANSVYVFAPGLVGTIVAVLLSPVLVRWPGERWLIGVSLLAFTVGMVLLGLIERVAALLAPASPLVLVPGLADDLSDAVLAAGVIAILIRFGAGAANTAVQSYISRRIAFHRQGAAFGVQNVLQNALGVVGTLTFGVLADRIGTSTTFILAPFVVIVVVAILSRRALRAPGSDPDARSEGVVEAEPAS